MTMIYARHGLLHIDMAKEELSQRLYVPKAIIAPSYCPFGYCNKELIDNRKQFEMVYASQLDSSEIEFAGTEPREGIQCPKIEDAVLSQMKHRFYGPIHNTPGPVVYEDDCINRWGFWVLYKLTKYADDVDPCAGLGREEQS